MRRFKSWFLMRSKHPRPVSVEGKFFRIAFTAIPVARRKLYRTKPPINTRTSKSACAPPHLNPGSPGLLEQTPADKVFGRLGDLVKELVGKLEVSFGDVAECLGVRVAAERREASEEHVGQYADGPGEGAGLDGRS